MLPTAQVHAGSLALIVTLTVSPLPFTLELSGLTSKVQPLACVNVNV